MAPNSKSGERWVLNISGVVIFLALLSIENVLPFENKYIGYFSPSILLFYLHIVNVEMFIRGIAVLVALIGITFILLKGRPYQKLFTANAKKPIIKYQPLFDWISVAVAAVACISLVIFDSKPAGYISYAGIIIVTLYIVVSNVIDTPNSSFKIPFNKRGKIIFNRRRKIFINKIINTIFHKKRSTIKRLKIKKYF